MNNGKTPSDKQIVLVVEDESSVREFIKVVLLDAGFEAIEAENGKKAVEMLKSKAGQIDIIVSDLMMPVMNGLELAKFNYDNSGLPFVVLTALYDTHMAINLLKYNVQDYVIKPIDDEKKFITVINNAAMRNLKRMMSHVELEPIYGNVSNLFILSRRSQLLQAIDWVRRQTQTVLAGKEGDKFVNYVHEFLVNSFEHGNLRIGEAEKSALLENGEYETEIKKREAECKARIEVDIAILKNRVSVKIVDEGKGFDFEKYLHMSEEMLIDRLNMPNGRGIYIAAAYFDSIEYSDGGASVLLTKNVPG
jgi:CheY-like chemotaxis protein